MRKNFIIKAALDGLIQSLILFFSGIFLFSIYASNLSLQGYLLIGLLGAIFSTIVYIAHILKESNIKVIAFTSLTSKLFFFLFMAIMLGMHLIFRFNFLPLREINDADGILFLFTSGCFILASIIIRTCIFVVLIVMHKSKT